MKKKRKQKPDLANLALTGAALIADWSEKADPSDKHAEVLSAMATTVLESVLAHKNDITRQAKVIALAIRAAYNFGMLRSTDKQ